MDRDEVLRRTEEFVRQRHAGDVTGHDWWHVERVRRLASRLAAAEGADLFVVELAALLHDIADWKFHAGDTAAGPRVAEAWLEKCEAPAEVIAHVCEIIGTLSFKGAGVPTPMATLEGQVVQDADRLDAIGAIGVARTFAYGGANGRPLHDPDKSPQKDADFETYRRGDGSTIHHFYEKLLLLKDRMNTEAARRMAAGRHVFTRDFLSRFLDEWDGRY